MMVYMDWPRRVEMKAVLLMKEIGKFQFFCDEGLYVVTVLSTASILLMMVLCQYICICIYIVLVPSARAQLPLIRYLCSGIRGPLSTRRPKVQIPYLGEPKIRA